MFVCLGLKLKKIFFLHIGNLALERKLKYYLKLLSPQNKPKNPDPTLLYFLVGMSLAETSQSPGAGSGEFLAQLWTKMLGPGVFQMI